TRDVEATAAQIKALAEAGCDLVRVSVFDRDCAAAVRRLKDASPVPLAADIHFDHELALLALENGIDKLRINPGNLRSEREVRLVADAAKAHGVPIRVGVNSGSLPKDVLARDGGVTAQGMVDGALYHIRMLEAAGFHDTVISLKTSDVRLTVDTYRLAARTFDYPLHLGVTEAGLPGQGTIKSAICVGSLLLDGIGDTVRVSLTGSPLYEPEAAISILRALGLRPGVELISCPTCGRTAMDVERVARAVEEGTRDIKTPLKVAVMGCVVNGPGEAKGADAALCGGHSGSALYIKGEFVRKITGDPVPEFLAVIRELAQKGT
ncbi:MAG TPA: flavodoxin-dependent (E)-4-hydroxy-3-methylbut-2-enyl-diphosphate synthase, partial [Candidatus Limnocylindria bacterium]|nr:flavodoxin-dependent (E)-4-hydroxy-3-methylbut-2-enyl-diphosphate synthase [Candidatus Limnocylindria bacterium]